MIAAEAVAEIVLLVLIASSEHTYNTVLCSILFVLGMTAWYSLSYKIVRLLQIKQYGYWID